MGLYRVLSSSIGRKLLMAVTGLLLCGFLVAHLAGNLFAYISADAYNSYADKLHSQEWLIKVAEIGLFTLFVVHLYMAIVHTIENRRARKNDYSMKKTKQKHAFSFFPENWMFLSGAIVLGFVVLHLVDYTFEARPDLNYENLSPFDKSVAILQNPISAGVYLLGCITLAFHLGHGVQSSLHTLGINHPKLHKLEKWLSVAFAAIIGVGFASFILWANLGHPTLLSSGASTETVRESTEMLEDTVAPTNEVDPIKGEK